MKTTRRNGFTLIEVMIVVAIIAIMASLGVPAYREYIDRGRVAGAVLKLTEIKVRLEQFYGSNRGYGGPAFPTSPCATAWTTDDGKFNITCAPNPAWPDTFLLTATSTDGVFVYTINESGVKTSRGFNGSTVSNCWIMKKGGSC